MFILLSSIAAIFMEVSINFTMLCNYIAKKICPVVFLKICRLTGELLQRR